MSSIVHKYRVYCDTDNKYEYVWSEYEPAMCPVNTSHSIDISKTSIVSTVGDDDPRTSDNRRIFIPNVWRQDVNIEFSGSGDDINNGARWAGTDLKLSQDGVGDSSLTWQYMDWHYLAGGEFFPNSGSFGDKVNYKIIAPSSKSIESLNPGAGAFDTYNLGFPGVNMYVPNPTMSGQYDLDLDAKLNANVSFTKAVPIPATNGDGFFDYDHDTNILTVNPYQTGGYNLFDFPMDLQRFIINVPVPNVHSVNLTVPAIRPKKILPHWIHQVDLHRDSPGTVEISWFIYIGRAPI